MKPSAFTMHTPRSLPEALRLKARLGQEGTLLAGGQSLVALMNFRVARPKQLISLSRIAALTTITVTERYLRIAAGVTYSELIRATATGTVPWPFQHVLRNIASEPIRNSATVGGALAQADPNAEFPALSLALDADVVLASTSGVRLLPVSEFFRGYMDTQARPDEIIVEIRFDRRRWEETWFGYAQVAQRQGDYADASVMVSYRKDAAERFLEPVVVSMKLRSFPCRWQGLMDALDRELVTATSVLDQVGQYLRQETGDYDEADLRVVESVLMEALASAERI